MEINGVKNSFTPIPPMGKDAVQEPQVQNETNTKKADKLEISNEARMKQGQKTESQKTEEVIQNIEKGFYNKNEVITKVADSVLQEIMGGRF